MTESDAPSRAVVRLLASIMFNVSLLCVGIFWLAGQFTTLMSWSVVGSGELTLQIGREGWLFQHTQGQWVTMLRGASLGACTVPRPSMENESATLWNVALADSNLTHFAPGVLLASEAQFRIVAIRHWLMFLIALLVWLIWHLAIPSLQKRKFARQVAEGDARLHG